jgi:hypothetical protein
VVHPQYCSAFTQKKLLFYTIRNALIQGFQIETSLFVDAQIIFANDEEI